MSPDEVEVLVEAIEGEVMNGGFDQFFFNGAGAEAARAVEALDVIGAHATAAIARRACAKFPGGMPPTDHDARRRMLVALWPDADGFESETREFQDYPDDLRTLLDEFLAAEGDPGRQSRPDAADG